MGDNSVPFAQISGGTYEPTFGGQDFGLASQDGTISPTPYAGSSAPPGLSPEQARQYVLNKIASGEANSYNEIYGGHTFQGFADHPRIPIPISSGPNVGKYSTAAGRYQFISSTWDDEAKRLGLSDFSPDSQDAAAWDLATRTYKDATGRSLLVDAQNGNVAWGKLGGQWESLQGAGNGPGLAKASSGGRNWQGGQVASGGTSAAPSGMVDPGISKEQQYLQLKSLIDGMFANKAKPQPQMAYNPWKYAGIGGPTYGG